MTTWCLEMRSTQNWDDVRYRDYTQSSKRADRFRNIPKLKFTDSSHGVVPHVSEHSGRRLPRVRAVDNYVMKCGGSL